MVSSILRRTTSIDRFFQTPQADSSHISTRFPFRKLFFPFVAAGNSMKRCRFLGHFCLWHLANRCQQADVEYMDWPWKSHQLQVLQVAINFWAAFWFGPPSVPECSDRSGSYLCKSFLGGIATWNLCASREYHANKSIGLDSTSESKPFWGSLFLLNST